MAFSERMGFRQAREAIQLDGMDKALRVALYNHLHDRFSRTWYTPQGSSGGSGYLSARLTWTDFWRLSADVFSDSQFDFCDALKRYVMEAPWYDVYDLLEFVTGESPMDVQSDKVNRILERDMSGYRMREDMIIQVSDSVELAAIDDALRVAEPFAGARSHILAALEKLSQRPVPDTRNAITEAVSAVESAARIVSGKHKATLADALKALDRDGSVHPALKDAWLKMYGYTSDEHGLRHAMTEDPDIDFPTAKYMVVACAAFVNLLSSLTPR